MPPQEFVLFQFAGLKYMNVLIVEIYIDASIIRILKLNALMPLLPLSGMSLFPVML